MRSRPVAEAYTWKFATLNETDFRAPGGIRTFNPSKRTAADPRLRTRAHRVRRVDFLSSFQVGAIKLQPIQIINVPTSLAYTIKASSLLLPAVLQDKVTSDSLLFSFRIPAR
jgi:hypothetical protein